MKYLVIVPYIELKLELYKFGKNRYTWFKFWDDFSALHNRCILNEFKFFIESENAQSSHTNMYIYTLVTANDTDEAYQLGTEKIIDLTNNLILLFLRGFKPLYHKIITMPFFFPESSPDTSISLISLIAKNGHIDKIITPYGTITFKSPHNVTISHDKYVTTYLEIPKIEDNIQITVQTSTPKNTLLNIEASIKKIKLSKYKNQQKDMINIMTTLYSTAVTTENISISYLLLWQIIESFASIKNSGKGLSEATKYKIKEILRQDSNVNFTRERIDSWLNILTEKGDVQIIAEILKEYVFPNKNSDELELEVKKYRRVRGFIVHPRSYNKLNENKLKESYKELREIIDILLRKLR